MSERLPLVSGQQVIAALAEFGFTKVSQRGSHVKVRHAAGRTAIVPLHKELARGTLRSILRQADVKPEDFVNALG